jgi:hypothetical protein
MCSQSSLRSASVSPPGKIRHAFFALIVPFIALPAVAEKADEPIIYVAQDGDASAAYGNGKLSILTLDAATPTAEIDSYINAPRMGADAAGNIYVVSYHSGTLTRYPAGGGDGVVLKRGLVGPSDVVVDRQGGIYISESYRVSYFPAEGGERVVVANVMASRLALDDDGNLYISSPQERTVFRRNAATNTLVPLITGVSFPTGMALDPAGNLYFSVAKTSEGDGPGIYRYSPGQSKPVQIVSGGESQGLATDAAGSLYMTWGKTIYKLVVGDAGADFEVVADNLKYPQDLVITPRYATPPSLRITSPNPQELEYLPTQRPMVQGTGAVGAVVTVSISSGPASGPVTVGTYVCNTTVSARGTWECESTVDLTPGQTFGLLASSWGLDGTPSRSNVSVAIKH